MSKTTLRAPWLGRSKLEERPGTSIDPAPLRLAWLSARAEKAIGSLEERPQAAVGA